MTPWLGNAKAGDTTTRAHTMSQATEMGGGDLAEGIGSQMILAEWLFVETVVDIRNRSRNPTARTRYELLGIAPLLRKLLLDNSPLVNSVRRGRPEVAIGFRIREWHPRTEVDKEDLSYSLRLAGAEIVGQSDDVPDKDFDRFMRTRIGQGDGEDLTVRDVVRYYANVEGGVHFGRPKDDGQATLNTMAPLVLGHSTGQIEILAHIGQVVLNALTPLCESILASPTIDRRMHLLDARGFYENHWTAEYARRSEPRHDG